MPRRKEEVKIDGRSFVVQELTVGEIIDYYESAQNATKKPELANNPNTETDLNTTSINFFEKELQNFINLALEGEHNWKDFINFAPSDLEKLWDKFKEVNSTFFGIARSMGIDQALLELINQFRSEFLGVLVASSSRAIRESLTTDTPILSLQ